MNINNQETVDKNKTENIKLPNGITSNITTTITELRLSKCGLKIVPEHVQQMKHLKFLDLSHNFLQVTPACLILGLEFLEALDLSYNLLTSFESQPKCYKKIKILRVNNNSMQNIPEWILYVTCLNLKEFNYSKNVIGSLESARFICNYIYDLRKLCLSNCRLCDEHFKCLKSIYTLEELDISNYDYKHFDNQLNIFNLFDKPRWLGTIKIIKLCNLHINELPYTICSLISLRELDLSKNNLDSLPNGFNNLKKLCYLNISCNNFYRLPSIVKELKNLRYLLVSNNIIYELPNLNFASLYLLDLYNNELNNFDKSLFNIDHLDLDLNYIECPDSAEYSGKKLSLRKFLKIEGRRDGRKLQVNASDSGEEKSSSEGDSEELSSENENTNLNLYEKEESWDLPVCNTCNPLITNSDNNWCWNENSLCPVNPVQNTKQVFVDYNVLFVDAEA